MIRGFVQAGRPFIPVSLNFSSLGNARDVSLSVNLLVDTGADTSTLHPMDSARMGVLHASDLVGLASDFGTGVGGISREFREVCEVTLRHEDGEEDRRMIRIGIAVPNETNLGFPSLMGRDLLRAYRLTFAEMSGLVRLDSTSQDA